MLTPWRRLGEFLRIYKKYETKVDMGVAVVRLGQIKQFELELRATLGGGFLFSRRSGERLDSLVA